LFLYDVSFPENGDGKMASYSILALRSVNAQLGVLLAGKAGYPSQDNGNFYNLLDAISMIGRNNEPTEYFYKDDVEALAKWCDDNGVRMTSLCGH
jgi:hypothetical protein